MNTTENIFRNIVEASPYPVYLCAGEEMIIQVANAATLKAWGKDESVIGKPFNEALPELDGQPFMELLRHVYYTGETYVAKNDRADILINDQMQTFYFDFTYQPMYNPAGKVIAVTCYATDVTAIERARQKAEESRKILYEIVKQAPVGICILKGDPFHVQIVNDSFLELIRRKEEDFDNQSYWGAIPEAASFYEPITRNVVATGQSYHAKEHEIMLLRNGVEETIFADFVYEPIIDFDGSSDTILVVATEVTDQVRARRSLQRLNDELAAAVEEQTAANEELSAMNEELSLAQETVLELNNELEEKVNGRTQELAGANEELATMNEELSSINEELSASLEEIQETQASLNKLNNELETRVANRTKDLSESEARFRNMAEGSGILITVGDENGNITYFSKPWTELTGKPVNDFHGFGWTEFLHKDDRDLYLDVYLSALKQKTPYTGEFRVLTGEGEYRWLLVKGSPRFRSDLSFIGFISSFMDITELKNDEQRKNDFIAMVSHELKTPLTSLNGYIQILQRKARKADDDFTVNALDTANKQVKKMTSMINGFLNISRLESGKIVLNRSSFKLDELIKSMVEETMGMEPGHLISYAINEPVTINADYDKISNVISNLLSNAIKYAPNDKNIEISCKVINGRAQVSVKDEGMGIKQQDIEKLFERYYRVENNHTISGFGIGLYLSAEIIERHHGKIWIESELGKGSTFYFSLPLN